MALRVAIKKMLAVTVSMCVLQLGAYSQETAVQAQGLYSSDFVIDGIPRNITFYIPSGFGKKDTYPLVIFLHEEGESSKGALKKYGDKLQQLADSSASIVLFPDAVKGHWNSRMANAATDTINDVGFVDIMIDYFVQQYHCDPERVYAAGLYSGGEMAWRLGCDRPAKIAAIAPFIPSQTEAAKKCTPSSGVAIFNTEKITLQPGKKIAGSILTDAWNFLLAHRK